MPNFFPFLSLSLSFLFFSPFVSSFETLAFVLLFPISLRFFFRDQISSSFLSSFFPFFILEVVARFFRFFAFRIRDAIFYSYRRF